ncbi:MAG: DUF4412 domain-containing protein [Crocinitomicaceae bacterium]
MNKFSVFILLYLSAFNLCFSQGIEAHITYKVEIKPDEDNPQTQMMAGMFEGSTMEVFFNSSCSRSEMQMGTMMKTTVITDQYANQSLTLMAGMFGKKAILQTLDDKNKTAKTSEPTFSIELTNETKTILGFSCKKAILKSEEGLVLTAWYTEDFIVNRKNFQFANDQIPGMPLEFDTYLNGLTLKMTALNLEKSLGKTSRELFDLTVPEAYEITTFEDMMKAGGR